MDTKTLKVVFLSRYSGTVNRGVETYVAELAKRLEGRCQVTILSGKDADSLWKVLKGKYDIVIPTNGRFQALKVSLGRLFRRYKVVIAGQAGVGRDDWWNIVIVRPHVFVALTERELTWAQRWARGIRLIKIPNGVDMVRFSPQGLSANVQLKKPIVLSVGALEWYKYHDRTIQALSHLSQFSLLIIGTGTQQEKLTKLATEKLGESRFKILHVPYEQIPDYYRSADIFTLPSWDSEAFGIVYLEALSSGLPVVAPDDDSRREIIGDAGILTNTSESEQFAQAIQQTYLRQWNDLPRLQASKFSWDKIAEEYWRLFQEMMT